MNQKDQFQSEDIVKGNSSINEHAPAPNIEKKTVESSIPPNSVPSDFQDPSLGNIQPSNSSLLESNDLSPVGSEGLAESQAPSGIPDYQTWGDFEVHGMLGQGAMGAVYKGRQLSLDRTVALKVLPPSLAADDNFVKRFELEAKAVARISSPHVVQVYAAGNHEGQEYFAMEFVEGTDLAKKLTDGYKPTYNEALDIVQQAARGLSAAGELGIIHRDIKPANMMITKKGIVKLMDFGLVKIASSETASLTMAGTLLGTVNYLSPEQGRGEQCDKRCDIYSLGIVLFELLTGRLPFLGDNPTSVLYQHNFVEAPSPRDIDPKIPEYHQAVVLKCIQKKADDRYQDAR